MYIYTCALVSFETGRRTPAFDCDAIALGDRIKSCNGQWLKGKTKDFVHELVRGAGERIVFQVIKDFEQVTFKADAKGGFRKVRFALRAMILYGWFRNLYCAEM